MADTDQNADAPEITEEQQVQRLNMFVGLAAKQPALALVGLFVMAGGGGTLGSMYVAPLVDEGLAAHESNDRAHNVDRIEDRLAALERKLDDQSVDLADVKGSVATAVRLLEAR